VNGRSELPGPETVRLDSSQPTLVQVGEARGIVLSPIVMVAR